MKKETRSQSKIIGRLREKKLLLELVNSKKAEFIALYGRRRIGKTYLIKNLLDKSPHVFFHFTGKQKGTLKEHLALFAKQIGATFYSGADLKPREGWIEAFEDLTKAISGVPSGKKVILFLDEFPWLAAPRSRLLTALELYWNRYWAFENRIKLVICGSATSWIIENIINNRGGLHNRVTRTIQLDPFSLSEVHDFLIENGIKLNHYQILDLYMVLGGVPLYWSYVEKGLSSHQCIDALCFQKDGPLVKEFDRLFASLFKDYELYVSLIRIIANHHYGISQSNLIIKSKLPNGGRTIHKFRQLEEAGFITSLVPYGHRDRGVYYVLNDEYCLFYLEWIEPNLKTIAKKADSQGFWLAQLQKPIWNNWAGYAFEAVCYKHIAQIRKALRIDPGANVGTWRYTPKAGQGGSGAQIDLLFDRPDEAITVCEIKCTNKPFAIDKTYAQTLANKMDVYCKQTKTKKQLFLAMITRSGLKPTLYSKELVSKQVILEDLFKEV